MLKKWLTRILAATGLLMLVMAFLFIKDLGYFYMQARGQLRILMSVQTVSEVLAGGTLTAEESRKLRLISDIKKFGEEKIGLSPTENFTTFFNQHGKPILWVLSASQPFEFKAHKWWFPVVGRVGYKGFFIRSKGEIEEKKLADKGLDTDFGEVSAWSTLGWFKDPVLSSMLKKSDGELARLILHEMTHSTVYIGSNADFNENFATLVGDIAADMFIGFYYGWESEELIHFRQRMNDLNLYQQTLEKGIGRLDSAYNYMEVNKWPAGERLPVKKSLIKKIKEDLSAAPFHMPARFASLSSDSTRLNNAFLLGFRMYRAQLDSLKGVLNQQYRRDIKAYLTDVKRIYE